MGKARSTKIIDNSISYNKGRIRKNFGHINLIASIPNLIEVQKNSYEKGFLQFNIDEAQRSDKGLQLILSSIFPIQDPSSLAILDFVKYEFDQPKYDVEECSQRSLSYAAPLKVTLRLSVWEVDEETGNSEIKGIKEQEVYMGDIPLMTKNGTFIINGTERVVVSQMHRSPGVFFYHDEGKSHASGKLLFSGRIIPYRGSWLDFEFDSKDILYFRIDRKRKLPATTLLKALGMSNKDILQFYYSEIVYHSKKDNWFCTFNPDFISTHRLEHDLVDADTNKVILAAGQKITPKLAQRLFKDGTINIVINEHNIIGQYLSRDVFDQTSGEVIHSAGEMITEAIIKNLKNAQEISVLSIGNQSEAYIRNTLFIDKNIDQNAALIDIFKVIRPGEPASGEAGKILLNSLLFDSDKYDLSEVGRIKMNAKLDLDIDQSISTITPDDIKYVIRVLTDLKDGKGAVDDIDHLSNRRVRSVGELLENQLRIAGNRMEKSILERMASVEIDTVMPADLTTIKLFATSVREFFSGSQLSQFMDQTNPLSEITHKRRISALGPGGLSRDRAGFEVRDVHPSHYGRICPIETPEGYNIGLINSTAIFARINKYGFIESPYRVVSNGKVTDEVKFLSAIEEGKFKIAQAKAKIDQENNLTEDLINCRVEDGNFVLATPSEVDFIDLIPMQVVSVAAALIPFLENDDANRALMGSNMQRQAVPLIKSEAPLVGTGIEKIVARDSGSSVIALRDGVVEQVDSTRIVVRASHGNEYGASNVDIYNLLKFQKSNHNTCINQKPLVIVGSSIKSGDIIADGPSTDGGEIALGRNVLVAFVPWSGYNFEDSILISEKIVKEDIFTSVHIEEFEVIARDTRLGPEEITRDIPNVGDENLRNIDETGIIYVGAEVKSGDVLVGKVTPKTESPMTPEEKLLRAIFGEKAADVRDSSLRVPPGISGTVVEVRVFSKRGTTKDERSIAIENQQIEQLVKNRDDELSIIEKFIFMRFESILVDQKIISGPKTVKSGQVIDIKLLKTLSEGQYWQLIVDNAEVMNEIELIKQHYDIHKADLNKKITNKVDKIKSGDDLPQGALKVVKIFIATKHKLQPGDKMAGRHGNKGVVSRIVPEEDMPFLEDGTVVDIVLNPLGLPSRMNIGQILETHLGWAAFNLGKKLHDMVNDNHSEENKMKQIRSFINKIYTKDANTNFAKMSDNDLIEFCKLNKKGIHFATPVFDGAKVEDVKAMLELASQPESGQVRLLDGRTGEYFDRNVTVGYKYILKLHHLVDDKIHARSIGPYSLVTQQPLGGKAYFGGQRVGEMECWALQAYGAAYILQEMLTVKSDDVAGRTKIYELIIKGDTNFKCGMPESFNVLVKELKALSLNVQLESKTENL